MTKLTILIPPGASTSKRKKDQSTTPQEKNTTNLPARLLMNPKDILKCPPPYSLTPQTLLNTPTSQNNQNTMRLQEPNNNPPRPTVQSSENQPSYSPPILFKRIISKKTTAPPSIQENYYYPIPPSFITNRTKKYNRQETRRKNKKQTCHKMFCSMSTSSKTSTTSMEMIQSLYTCPVAPYQPMLPKQLNNTMTLTNGYQTSQSLQTESYGETTHMLPMHPCQKFWSPKTSTFPNQMKK
jgi:hypothetical protein